MLETAGTKRVPVKIYVFVFTARPAGGQTFN